MTVVKTEWSFMTHEAIVEDVYSDKNASSRERDLAQRVECLLEMLKEHGNGDDTGG